MKTARKGRKEIGIRLLEAACKVFAEKGFRGATIMEISSLAGANIASINYHFGDKKTLYVEAWRYAFATSIEQYPPDGGVPDNASPKERLKGHIGALLRRLSDKNTLEFLIARTELTNPTGLLQDVLREEIAPIHRKLKGIVADLLGPSASEPQIKNCVLSIISLCIEPMVLARSTNEQNGKGLFPPIDDIEEFVEHVIQFSLGGLKSIKASGLRKR